MAYKFQRGKAILSGSITAEQGFDADGQEASNFATISNGGSQVTIVENTEVRGNVRISGSNALELGDNQHAIKNLANNLELQVGGNTKLDVKSNETEARQHVLMSGSQELRFGGTDNKIFSANGVQNLEMYAGNTKILELRNTQIDAERHIQISGSQELRFGGNQSAIFKAAGVQNLELKADGATRLEIQSGQIEAKTHLRMSGSQEVQFQDNQYSIKRDGSALKLKVANSDNILIDNTRTTFQRGVIKVSGSGVNPKIEFGTGLAEIRVVNDQQVIVKGSGSIPFVVEDEAGERAVEVGANYIGLEGDLRVAARGGSPVEFLSDDRAQLTLANSSQIGTSNDTDLIGLASGVVTVAGAVSATELTGALAFNIDAGSGIDMNLFDNTANVTVGIATGGVTNGMLANSTINLAAGAGLAAIGNVALGATASIAVDGVLEDLDALTAVDVNEFIVGTGAGVYAHQSGDTARTSLGLGTGDSPTFAGLTVNGDLTVTGSLTYVNTTNLAITDAQITIGSGSSAFANGYGLEFGAMDGGWAQLETATINSDNYLTSSLNFSAPIVYAPTALITNDWEINSTHISGGLPVSASAFVGDGSQLTNISATGVRLTAQTMTSGGSITAKLVLLNSTGGGFTATLPAVASNIGEMYIIKDSVGQCEANPVVIDANGTEVIDGDASVELESAGAAISLFGTSGGWIIV